MPPITRWFIKAGIFWFITGMILAFLAELPVSIVRCAAPSRLLAYAGRRVDYSDHYRRFYLDVSEEKAGSPKKQSNITIASFGLLNAGLVIRFLSEPFIPLMHGDFLISVSVIVSSLLQVLGILLYVIEIWPRLQPKSARKKKTGGR